MYVSAPILTIYQTTTHLGVVSSLETPVPSLWPRRLFPAPTGEPLFLWYCPRSRFLASLFLCPETSLFPLS